MVWSLRFRWPFSFSHPIFDAQACTDVMSHFFPRPRICRFYSFAPLTLIPMQKKLLDHALMTSKELDWLDEYHKTVSGAAGHPRVYRLVDCFRPYTSLRCVLHCLNREKSCWKPGLDKTAQAGGGRRGACMVEGSHSPSDKAAIDARRVRALRA